MDATFFALQSALAGEYSLVRELGRGGMGIVYLAREVRLTRDVAIKVLRPELAALDRSRDQFLREAQMAARLSHPNIVPIHRVSEAGAFVYIVMAFVPGVTLAQHVAEHGPLAPHRAVRMMRDVAWALGHAHGVGIVHRDVKADNIMIETGTGRALMTDFGLANAERSSTTARADEPIIGSAHYISPEQIGGEPADARSDIYSFGIAGYLALTGRLPFDGKTTGEVFTKHLSTTPAPIRSIAGTVPASVAQVVERCMSRQPRQRFQTTSDIADALDSAMGSTHEIPAAVRVWAAREEAMGGSYRLAKIFGIGAALVGALVALTSGDAVLLLPFLAAGVITPAMALLQVRRVLAAGYTIDDLRAGMREHWVRRTDELQYEFGGRTLWGRWIGPLLGAAALTIGLMMRVLPNAGRTATLLMVFGSVGGIGLAAGLAAVKLRRLRVTASGSSHLAFWNSPKAERFVKMLSFGLRPRTLASGIPQRTEIALGRATDALFNALPKPVRRELAALPAVVKRLETDARQLRLRLDELDATAASLPRAGDRGGATDARASALAADLAGERDRVETRLGAVVAALENIRLDLLRLQLGTGRIESVTATLDAARETAVDLDALAGAYETLADELSPTT